VRGVELSFEIGTRYRDPATWEIWLDYPAASSWAWMNFASDGRPLSSRAQRTRDAERILRALAVGAVRSSNDGAWRVLADWARLALQ